MPILSADLEIATTLPSQSDNSDCAGPQVWTAFQPSLCEDRPLQVDSYDCKQKPKKHVDTPDAVVKSSPPPPPQGMINTPQSIPTSDNHTQISAQPPMTHGRQKPTEVTKVHLIISVLGENTSREVPLRQLGRISSYHSVCVCNVEIIP